MPETIHFVYLAIIQAVKCLHNVAHDFCDMFDWWGSRGTRRSEFPCLQKCACVCGCTHRIFPGLFHFIPHVARTGLCFLLEFVYRSWELTRAPSTCTSTTALRMRKNTGVFARQRSLHLWRKQWWEEQLQELSTKCLMFKDMTVELQWSPWQLRGGFHVTQKKREITFP